MLRHPVFRVLFLISASFSFAQTQASDKNGESPLADTVRQLANEVQQLKLSIEELRTESDRFRAETRELRRELDASRSQPNDQHSELDRSDAALREAKGEIADNQGVGSAVPMEDRVAKLEDEFRLLEIPFKERAQRTHEYIHVMKLLWTQEKPRFAGKFVQINEDLNLLPYPLQKPHPPIWVGGESQPALKRVAEFGDGWHIGLVLPERIPQKLQDLKQLMEKAGRDFSKLELTALADPNRLKDNEIRAYHTAGVHVLYMLPLSSDHRAVINDMRSFAQRMKAFV